MSWLVMCVGVGVNSVVGARRTSGREPRTFLESGQLAGCGKGARGRGNYCFLIRFFCMPPAADKGKNFAKVVAAASPEFDIDALFSQVRVKSPHFINRTGDLTFQADTNAEAAAGVEFSGSAHNAAQSADMGVDMEMESGEEGEVDEVDDDDQEEEEEEEVPVSRFRGKGNGIVVVGRFSLTRLLRRRRLLVRRKKNVYSRD